MAEDYIASRRRVNLEDCGFRVPQGGIGRGFVLKPYLFDRCVGLEDFGLRIPQGRPRFGQGFKTGAQPSHWRAYQQM